MAIDQTALGQQTQALMEEIENDPEIPDPHVSIGFLEVAKQMQLKMMGL